MKIMPLTNKLLNRKFHQMDFKKLEGIQQGLKSFDGLSLKQIAFALTDLHSINMISGCTNHCLHCYANAQPFLKRYPYEDLAQICSDTKELKERLGVNPAYHRGQNYTDCSFDADGIDCHLFDKDGNKHDFIEIAKIMKEGLGTSPVFDTNGWKQSDKDKQARAEEYVKKLLENENYKNFHQINVSINPFNPLYIRALKSKYPLEKLYTPFIKLDEVISEDLENDRKIYTRYIKNTANTLMTFKPILNIGKLGLIIRALEDKFEEMQGFRITDFSKVLQDIFTEISHRRLWGEIQERELDKYAEKLSMVDPKLFTSGRMEKFYWRKNPGNKNIENIDPNRIRTAKNLERIKSTKRISATDLGYLKMIAPDGKVYMYDNYHIIPTDIQLNTSTKDLEKPFRIPVEDFVLTEDMIDRI